MACLKCGKKTTDEQSFCSRCLEIMEAYPVKQDVHIQLPNRPGATDFKKSTRKRRTLSVEEQVVTLRKRTRRLTAALFVLVLLLAATAALLAQSYLSEEDLEWGKNYTYDNPFD